MSTRLPISEAKLDTLQRETFDYFIHEANPANGLIVDKTAANWPASIAATGLALAAYPIGVERGFLARSFAAERTLTTLRFCGESSGGSDGFGRRETRFEKGPFAGLPHDRGRACDVRAFDCRDQAATSADGAGDTAVAVIAQPHAAG